jgi:hypothetical protein
VVEALPGGASFDMLPLVRAAQLTNVVGDARWHGWSRRCQVVPAVEAWPLARRAQLMPVIGRMATDRVMQPAALR